MKADGVALTRELEQALDAMQKAFNNTTTLYDYQTCLKIGDIWLHLESVAAGIEHFCTTNYRESELLCESLGLKMRDPNRI